MLSMARDSVRQIAHQILCIQISRMFSPKDLLHLTFTCENYWNFQMFKSHISNLLKLFGNCNVHTYQLLSLTDYLLSVSENVSMISDLLSALVCIPVKRTQHFVHIDKPTLVLITATHPQKSPQYVKLKSLCIIFNQVKKLHHNASSEIFNIHIRAGND